MRGGRRGGGGRGGARRGASGSGGGEVDAGGQKGGESSEGIRVPKRKVDGETESKMKKAKTAAKVATATEGRASR